MRKLFAIIAICFISVLSFAQGKDSLFYKSGEIKTGTISNFHEFQNVQMNLKNLSFKFQENKKEKISTEGLTKVVYNGVTYMPAPYTKTNYKLMQPISLGKVNLFLFSGSMQTSMSGSGSSGHNIAFYILEKGDDFLLLMAKFKSEYYFEKFNMQQYRTNYTSKGVTISNLWADKSNTKRIRENYAKFFSGCPTLKTKTADEKYNMADIITLVDEYNNCEQ
jgi:hypothetical protein